jgi:hypothetical protein
LAERLAKKSSRAHTEPLDAGNVRNGGGAATCPGCGEAIYPSTWSYLPRRATYKQYQCTHCGAWLTIDLRSRIKLIAVSSLGFVFTCYVYLQSLIAIGVPIQHYKNAVIWPFAVISVFLGGYAMARYMKKIAQWKVIQD